MVDWKIVVSLQSNLTPQTMETLYGRKGIRESFMAGTPETMTKEEKEAAYQLFLSKNHEYQSAKPTAREVVEVVTDYLNTFNDQEPEFIKVMQFQHRTLQQSFTKLVLKWIEHIASPAYNTDGRNEGSQKTAQKLMKGWEMLGKEDETQTYHMNPSRWISCI